MKTLKLCVLLIIGLLISCKKKEEIQDASIFELLRVEVGDQTASSSSFVFENVSPQPEIILHFSEPINQEQAKKQISLQDESSKKLVLEFNYPSKNVLQLTTNQKLKTYAKYKLIVWHDLKAESGASLLSGKSFAIHTGMDTTYKFPILADEDLLTLVQQQCFKYFWDFAHPVSGMARERSTSGDLVTTGGTGFGVMATLVASERKFIERNEALQHIRKVVHFLATKCTRYHGAFSHWLNGNTGATIAFSTKDNGADLLETSLLFQGLLCARAYFTQNTPEETELRTQITNLWEAVEWSWFCNKQNVLYWHWSPQYNWEINLPIRGWNEGLITYILAAASPTYPINKEVYHQGWASGGAFVQKHTYYGIPLTFGTNYGGPLFFSQYSFLGINPKGLKDQYANYWEQNRNHARIHYQYCIQNPNKYAGYSNKCWGLTACDGNKGYSAHYPGGNDRGVIAPTAALSSFPYTPEESMQALHFYYYVLGDKLWKEYGFTDAFNLSVNWYAHQYIAIDQGPIILMIENYRSGLLWNLFMPIPEIQKAFEKCGFTVGANQYSSFKDQFN